MNEHLYINIYKLAQWNEQDLIKLTNWLNKAQEKDFSHQDVAQHVVSSGKSLFLLKDWLTSVKDLIK